MKHWMKIGYWNIHGLFYNGESKLGEDEVLNCVKKHDIMCLSEVHCSDSSISNIDGFNCFKLCRGLNKRINRYFGGVVIYYRKEIRDGIKFLPNR